MKKLSLIAAALLALSGTTFAGTTSDTFAVSVSFTSACTVSTTANDLSFTYVGMQVGAATDSTGITFSCTRNFVNPTFTFDDTDAVRTASAAASSGTITAEGLLKGLRYTLSAAVPTVVDGTDASAGALGTGGSNGTADAYTLTINANMPGGQAGDNTAGATTHNRTLTISF
ncbi:MAG: hypothetical protein HY854_07925 [Burkholderiales bacterium]|nr:hypothetical protein [Burkholderiales bacterium]